MNLITHPLAHVSGIPEPTLRLLITLALAYPIAAYYQRTLLKPLAATAIEERNSFLLASGLALSFFFNGLQIFHSLITVLITYGILWFADQLHDRKSGAIAVFIFNGLYLLMGYWGKSGDEYEINWTMSQCVLCLRLMGLGMDLYDGREGAAQPSKMPGSQSVKDDIKVKRSPLSFGQDTALEILPSLSHVLAYSYFPSAFLIGPQFSYSLYRKFITFEQFDNLSPIKLENAKVSQRKYVEKCVTISTIYLLAQQIIGSKYATSYLLTSEFASLNIFKRLVIFWITGACALFGISFAGPNNDQADFSGLANVAPKVYELATSTNQVIASFNMNTNLWVKVYIFKRLKFLNNKSISQAASLAFLAVWHGFHFNYFLTFLMEFLDVEAEGILAKHLVPLVHPEIQKNPTLRPVWKVVAWLTCTFTVNYAMVGFDLLLFRKAWIAYKNVWFLGHFAVATILLTGTFMKPPRSTVKKTE
ncbi:MBOAT, membrane-bound O-acyltransferase family-domain-containing protein [Umbelopsis sp. PMI_123]|nr:MBOAT, membrane-bound O-acyltransferase family-domain-containing protein [Umbelopsis sp. PMI_123]